MYFSLFEAGILGPLASPANLETPESLSTEDVSTIVQVPVPSGRRLQPPVYFFLSSLPLLPQPPRQRLGPSCLLLTNTVSPERARLIL